MVFTVVPRVLDEVEPFCRSCKKPVRKDCSAAVLAVLSVEVPDDVVEDVDDDPVDAADAVEAVDDVDEEVSALDVPAVVPPRSEINFENAVFNADIVLDDTVEGAPSAVDVSVMSSLLLRSVSREESAATMPRC
jgi:hypothetical protein